MISLFVLSISFEKVSLPSKFINIIKTIIFRVYCQNLSVTTLLMFDVISVMLQLTACNSDCLFV